jgi:hypothetical protein
LIVALALAASAGIAARIVERLAVRLMWFVRSRVASGEEDRRIREADQKGMQERFGAPKRCC